jgi:hypothetical protein
MAKDINLLPKVVEAEIKRSEYKRFGSVLSLSLIGLVVLIVVGLFVWSFLTDRTLQTVERNITNREEGIKDNLDKELKMRAIATKIRLIKPLLASEYDYSDIVDRLQAVAQTSASVVTSEVILEGTSITYTGRAPSSQALDDYFTTLLDPQVGGRNFKKVYLTSLSRSETLPEYRFSIKMSYVPSSGGPNGGQ